MIGELFNSIIFLTGPVGFAFVSFIVVLFIWGIFRFLFPVGRTTRIVRKAARRIASGQSAADAFRGAPQPLSNAWAGFLEERAASSVGDAGSATAPEKWLNPGTALPTYNRSGALALAGAFAGLGILGTFVGLMIGLVGLDTTQQQVLESVTSFMGGMYTAFSSSIFGIGASLVWLGLDRAIYNRFLVRLSELHSVVRRHMPTVDAEQLLAGLVIGQRDTRELLSEQKGILQNLGTDVSAAFEEAINRTLAPAMTNISESLDTMSTQVSEQQAEALGEMARQFQEELMGNMANQFGSLADSVQAAADYQARVNDDISRLFDKLVAATEGQVELIQRTRDASESFSASVESLGEMQSRLADSASAMHAVTQRLDTLSAGLAQQTSEYGSAQERLQELMAAQLDASAAQIAELDGFLSSLSSDLQGLSSNLERSITEFSGLAADKLAEVFNRFDSELSTVVNHLSGTLAQIRDVTEDLPRALEDLRSVVGETTEPIRAIEGQLASASEVIRSLDRLRGATEETSRELQRSGSTLARLEEQLATGAPGRTDGRPPGVRTDDGGRVDDFRGPEGNQ